MYSSDLERTQSTMANLLQIAPIGIDQKKNEVILSRTWNDVSVERCMENNIIRTHDSVSLEATGVKLDPRWRENAKGAREGYHKSMSMSEAVKHREQLLGKEKTIPIFETDDDAWYRVTDWLKEVIMEAFMEENGTIPNGITEGTSKNSRSEEISQSQSPIRSDSRIYNILVVGHSAILRVFLTRLLGQNVLRNHPNAVYTKAGVKLDIPNASLTIVDIAISTSIGHLNELEEIVSDSLKHFSDNGVQCASESLTFSCGIILLNSTSHLTVE
jgi:broad specificity phosphatase PhoE